MKKKLFLGILMLLVLLTGAFAATASDVSFAQNRAFERSNPLIQGSKSLLDHRDEIKYISYSIRVTAGTENLTISSLSPTAPFTYDGFGGPISSNMTFEVLTTLPRNVTAGQSVDIQVRVMVPSDLDSVDTNLAPVRYEYPVLVQTSDGSLTSKLQFFVKNGLELDNVEVTSDSETYYCDVELGSLSLDCDRDIEELPIKDFVLKFDIENMFDYRDDIDFDRVRITIDSDNRNVKPSKRSYDEDIDAEEVRSFSTTFTVDDRVKDGDRATIRLTAEVTDDNDAKHGFEYEFDVRFRVPDYQVDVSNIELQPQVLCQGDSANLLFTVVNEGRRSQSNVRVQVINSELGLDKVSERIALEAADSRRNTEYSGTIQIPTRATNAAKVYPISVRVYHRDEDSSDAFLLRTVSLVVERCDASGNPISNPTTPTTPTTGNGGTTQTNTTTPTTQSPIVVIQPTEVVPTTQQPTQSGSNIGATIVARNDTLLIIGLAVVAVILLIVVIALVIMLARR
jgi:hypothetical protein